MTTAGKIKGRRPKSVLILELLLAGFPVKFPGDEHTWYYQGGIFGIEAKSCDTERPGWSEDVLLGVEVTIPQFIEMCEKFTDEEIYLRSCERVLTEHMRKRGRL